MALLIVQLVILHEHRFCRWLYLRSMVCMDRLSYRRICRTIRAWCGSPQLVRSSAMRNIRWRTPPGPRSKYRAIQNNWHGRSKPSERRSDETLSGPVEDEKTGKL